MEDKSNQKNVFRIPEEEILRRINGVQKELHTRRMDGLFIVQRIDLLYFSGTAQNGFVFIPAEGEPLLLVKKFVPRALEESPLHTILSIQSIREIPGIIRDHQGRLPTRLGFESDVMPMREFQFYEKLFAGTECVDGSPAIHAVRSVKSQWELLQMEATAKKSLELFEYLGNHIEPGEKDIEISTRAEYFARSIGHGAALRIRDYQKTGFPLSSLAGTPMGKSRLFGQPSVREGNCLIIEPKGTLNQKVPFTVESRFFLNGYHMYEARVGSIGPLPGAINEMAKRLFQLQQEILAHVKAGIAADSLFRLSLEKAHASGLSTNTPGADGTRQEKILGSGVGLELVEPPVIAKGNQQTLKAGMALSLYSENRLDDRQILRIRDVVLVTENGHRKITRLPQETFIW